MGFRTNFEDEKNTDPNLVSSPFVSTQPNAATTNKNFPMPDLGLLNPLIQDSSITEIMVNDLRNIAIEKLGQIVVTPVRFKSLEELYRVVRTLLDPAGKTVSPENPMETTSLPDGSRVHIVTPPIVEGGPCITIRRFPRRFEIVNLISNGTMDRRMAHFLEACVIGKQNIVISGGTGTGKTTLLNSLIAHIPPHERVITIEDSAEILQILPNQVKMMTRPSKIREENIDAKMLIQNSLRMRPDRILVGECRGAEALDMIQAMNTGHQGSFTTLHANSPRDALYRLETLMMSANKEIPIMATRRQLASAVQLIVQIKRFTNGSRRVISIQEITGMESETILLQEIFSYEAKNEADPNSESGSFRFNVSSKVFENLRSQGIKPLP
jgi:pilus assembly protein CpaF